MINFENDQFKVGHTGILTKNITASTLSTDDVSVEAWMEGVLAESKGTVRNRKLYQGWAKSNFYLMELKERKNKLKFNWRKGFHLETTYHDINKNTFATKGESYLGKKYLLNLHDFAHMKLTASIANRFACTSHVWLAGKTVNVNVSANFFTEIITPRDIYNDPETFIKAEIKNIP